VRKTIPLRARLPENQIGRCGSHFGVEGKLGAFRRPLGAHLTSRYPGAEKLDRRPEVATKRLVAPLRLLQAHQAHEYLRDVGRQRRSRRNCRELAALEDIVVGHRTRPKGALPLKFTEGVQLGRAV